jgi:hypothetical protein
MPTERYKKQEYINWLLAEIDNQTSYHNHKETVAWTALAFYIPAIIALGYYAGQAISTLFPLAGASCGNISLFTFIGVIIIGLPCLWAFMFIRRAFVNRWTAHNRTAQMRRAIGLLLNGRMVLDEENTAMITESNWPQFVNTIIPEALDVSDINDDKRVTQGMSQAAVIFLGIIALLAYAMPLIREVAR